MSSGNNVPSVRNLFSNIFSKTPRVERVSGTNEVSERNERSE